MINLVLVVFCPICRWESAAYDPLRVDPIHLGTAVRNAAQNNLSIEFRPSPVELNLRVCQCEKSRRETSIEKTPWNS